MALSILLPADSGIVTAIMYSLNRLSQDDARQLLDGARNEANAIGVPVCIAISDESGHLIAFERMDGAKIISTTLAQDKAATAAISRKGTHEYNAASIPGNLVFGIHTALQGRFSIVGGGLPVSIDDEVVGGIGVSGGTPEQDMQCAEAGLHHFLK